MIPEAASELLELFLPRGCLACGGRISPEEGDRHICTVCRTRLRRPPPPRCPRCDAPLGTGRLEGAPCLECRDWPDVLGSARAAAVLEHPADALVHALKYGGWRCLGELMGGRMARLHRAGSGRELVVPVPTTPRRRRIRGYNQAGVLAEAVGRQLDLEVLEALGRTQGGTQVRSGPAERRRKVQDTFQCNPALRSRIRGREVILVDDVLTTGATAAAAAAALAAGEVGRVRLLTFARALPFQEGRDRRVPFG